MGVYVNRNKYKQSQKKHYDVYGAADINSSASRRLYTNKWAYPTWYILTRGMGIWTAFMYQYIRLHVIST
jgi:hypothetical protein